MFDYDARLAALEKPSLKVDGQMVEGQHLLSLDEGAVLRRDFELVMAGQRNEQFVRDLTRRLLTALSFTEAVIDRVLATYPMRLLMILLVDFSGALPLGVGGSATNQATPPSDSEKSSSAS